MKDLLDFYERELIALQRAGGEFAARYPGPASRLHMSGETCGDPHVERIIQATALLSARISKVLEDSYPQITESFFETLFPHYLRAYPACAIVRIETDPDASITVPRGTELRTATIDGVACRFRTVYEIPAAPATLASVLFTPAIQAPASLRVAPESSSTISMVLTRGASRAAGTDLPASPLRVYLDGNASLCAATRDCLLDHFVGAYVETPSGEWLAVSGNPAKPVGFADDDALVPFAPRSHPAYRLLAEYFTFPDKFNFIDLDLNAALRTLPSDTLTFKLHLLIEGVLPDSSTARILASLSSRNLLTGCSPVVNLFSKTAVPISVTHKRVDYPLLADANHAHAYDVHTVDAVRMLKKNGGVVTLTDFKPFYAWEHAAGSSPKSHYYVVRRDEKMSARSPGYGHKIAFVDVDFDPLQLEQASVSIELTCSNGTLPSRPEFSRADGTLTLLADLGIDSPIRFIRRPTAPYRFRSANGMHWRLISHLTLNHHSLLQGALPALREMLTLYNLPQSVIGQRQIDSIVGLAHRPTTAWIKFERGATLVHGVEVHLQISEEGFVGSSLHLFVSVIDRFLGLYVQANSFTELLVSNQHGKELMRCKPRTGQLNLA